MAERAPIPLTPVLINLESPDLAVISSWPYPDAFVGRLLGFDIPRRMEFGDCQLWGYRDPGGEMVGFGALAVSADCAGYADAEVHPYIPLLAVNPTIKSLGYGTTIVLHLIQQAVALPPSSGGPHSHLFLDVYTTSEKAIAVDAACGFETVSDEPIPDLQAEGKLYIIMAKKLRETSA